MALSGHGAKSEWSPFSGVKRKLDLGAVRAAFDPNGTLRAPRRELWYPPFKRDGTVQ